MDPPPLAGALAAAFADPSALVVLVATVLGFLLPMLWIYPPVAPRPSDFLSETHAKLGEGWARLEEAEAGPKEPSSSTATPRIHSLWVYPIKSCPGIRVPRSRVRPTGLEFDRLFTFAQLKTPFPARAGVSIGGTEDPAEPEASWDFITQRQFPRLAALQVELWRPDLAKVRRAQARMRASDRAERAASMGVSFVVVRYPWAEAGWAGRWAWTAAKLARGLRAVPEVEVVLPLQDDGGSKRRESSVRIWRDVLPAVDLSDELPRSLQLFLGVSNRLGVLRVDPAHVRQIFRCAPRKEQAGYQPVTGFQDAVGALALRCQSVCHLHPADRQYPVHLLNRNSVHALESLVPVDKDLPDLDERRFRANIIGGFWFSLGTSLGTLNTERLTAPVDGIPAYDEDS